MRSIRPTGFGAVLGAGVGLLVAAVSGMVTIDADLRAATAVAPPAPRVTEHAPPSFERVDCPRRDRDGRVHVDRRRI